MNKPSISIIIPVYNVAPYVENCIRSVINQTYDGKMECIIVDDCGTDNSMAIVERVITEYNGSIIFKVLHHDHNRGLSAARNTGMNVTKGEYLFFLDSDDMLMDDCLEKLTDPLSMEWYDVVVGDLLIDGGDKSYTGLKLRIPDDTVFYGMEIVRKYRNVMYSMAFNKLYRGSFIRRSKFEFKDGLIHEDDLWSFQVVCLASSLYVKKYPTYIYRIRNNGIMGSTAKSIRYYNYAIVVEEMIKFVKDNNCYNEYTHDNIQGAFFKTLRLCIPDYSVFRKYYNRLCPIVKPSLRILLKSNKYNCIKYIRDFHYILPLKIAPYWQFLVFILDKK